ncbi:MAG: hypothetical protein RI907_2466 [Pseudomonadota bacterium]|jgi:hypothetical protein
MKSPSPAQAQVEPELRAESEAALLHGETHADFANASRRSDIEFRQAQLSFHERGDASWARFQQTGVATPASEVLGRLSAKLTTRRKQVGGA